MTILSLCILGIGQKLQSQVRQESEFLTSDLVLAIHELNQLQRELLRLNHQVISSESARLKFHTDLVQSRITVLQTYLGSHQERSSFAPGVTENLYGVIEQWQSIKPDIDLLNQGLESISTEKLLTLKEKSKIQLSTIELEVNQLAHINREYQWNNYNQLIEQQRRSLNDITYLALLFFTFSLLFGLYTARFIQTRQQLLDEMKQASTTDELTQIGNRRYFNQVFYREWNHMIREQKPMTLILCDIDFFKQYNDHYGHQAGDLCLYRVAQALASGVRRSNEAVARYGGEEFVIILPNTSREQAEDAVARLQQQVRQTNLEHRQSDISDQVTLSMGVAMGIPVLSLKPEHALESADRALYQAKAHGRNRACFQCFDDKTEGAKV